MRKIILFGSLLSLFLMLMIPNINAVECYTFKNTQKSLIKECFKDNQLINSKCLKNNVFSVIQKNIDDDLRKSISDEIQNGNEDSTLLKILYAIAAFPILCKSMVISVMYIFALILLCFFSIMQFALFSIVILFFIINKDIVINILQSYNVMVETLIMTIIQIPGLFISVFGSISAGAIISLLSFGKNSFEDGMKAWCIFWIVSLPNIFMETLIPLSLFFISAFLRDYQDGKFEKNVMCSIDSFNHHIFHFFTRYNIS